MLSPWMSFQKLKTCCFLHAQEKGRLQMFYSEWKKLPVEEELEQMKALSNVIKQYGTVREGHREYGAI